MGEVQLGSASIRLYESSLYPHGVSGKSIRTRSIRLRGESWFMEEQ